MKPEDEEGARAARAARLRKRIAEVTHGAPPAGTPSPRDFIEERMRELDKETGPSTARKGTPKR